MYLYLIFISSTTGMAHLKIKVPFLVFKCEVPLGARQRTKIVLVFNKKRKHCSKKAHNHSEPNNQFNGPQSFFII